MSRTVPEVSHISDPGYHEPKQSLCYGLSNSAWLKLKSLYFFQYGGKVLYQFVKVINSLIIL